MRMSPSSLCCKTLIFLFLLALVELCVASKARHFKWEVGYLFWSPDCLENVVMGINGQFPGPTIRAKVGDTVVVHLTNKLHTEGLVIHWHGIRQFDTPWADGTASISQCVINPEETFEYRFKVDKAGTYFYHGHYGMQRSAGLYGSLIVEPVVKEPFRYDGELNLLLSDWWHQGVHEQEVGLSSNPLRWIGEPQSILMNGRGQYNCSLAAHFKNSSSKITTPLCSMRSNAQCAPHVLHVLPNKIYRLRIASTTSLASLNLAIGHHKMVLVEADGNYVDPVTVDDLDIYSGETYSLLIKTNQNPSANYWVSASVRGRLPKTPPALTILNYLPNSAKLPTSPPPVAPAWNDYVHSKSFTKSIFALTGSPKPPAHPHRRIHLLNTQNKINGFTKWAINNISLVLPSTPYLGSIKLGLTAGKHNQQTPPDNFSKDYDIMKPPINPNSTTGSGVYTLEFGRTIDVVLQNANALSANVSEIHPWHLHGHDFWVLGYGEGVFSEEKHSSQLNLKNPPLRNTVVIFPYGWTVIRFITDNPGVWAFHCHIEPHLHMGMGVIFSEAVKHITNIPNAAIGCGLTGKMLMNNSTKH